MVTLLYFGAVREKTNCPSETAEIGRVRDAVALIRGKYGRTAATLAARSLITVDGVRVRSLSDPLPDGCTVRFLPLCSGG